MTEQDYEDAKALDFDFTAGAEFMLSRFVGTGFGSGRMLDNGMLELHTGGWSECERLIDEAMYSLWWFRWWYQSMRGGHYLFGDPRGKGEEG